MRQTHHMSAETDTQIERERCTEKEGVEMERGKKREEREGEGEEERHEREGEGEEERHERERERVMHFLVCVPSPSILLLF